MTVNWNCFRTRTGETNEEWKAKEKGSGGQSGRLYNSQVVVNGKYLFSLPN